MSEGLAFRFFNSGSIGLMLGLTLIKGRLPPSSFSGSWRVEVRQLTHKFFHLTWGLGFIGEKSLLRHALIRDFFGILVSLKDILPKGIVSSGSCELISSFSMSKERSSCTFEEDEKLLNVISYPPRSFCIYAALNRFSRKGASLWIAVSVSQVLNSLGKCFHYTKYSFPLRVSIIFLI